MTFLSVLFSIISFIAFSIYYPITTLASWLIICISPILHLAHYIFHFLFLPIRLLSRFETLYIYLSVAILIGLLLGSLLYYSNTVLISILDLGATPADLTSAPNTRTVREEKNRQRQRRSLDATTPRMPIPVTIVQQSALSEQHPRIDGALKREVNDWWEQDRKWGSRVSGGEGLLGQTILEEDDDDSGGL